jgi:hypothetical protein
LRCSAALLSCFPAFLLSCFPAFLLSRFPRYTATAGDAYSDAGSLSVQTFPDFT